jgi:hypothetical protein
MKEQTGTPQRSGTHGVDKTTADKTTADKTTMAAAPAPTEEDVRRRQLERSVALTGRERFRCLWYRLRLTIAEMNYATRRLTELQRRLP